MSSHHYHQDFPRYKPVRLVFLIAWLAVFAGAMWVLGAAWGTN